MNTFTSLSTNCCWTALKGKVTEWHKSTCKNLWNKKKCVLPFPFTPKKYKTSEGCTWERQSIEEEKKTVGHSSCSTEDMWNYFERTGKDWWRQIRRKLTFPLACHLTCVLSLHHLSLSFQHFSHVNRTVQQGTYSSAHNEPDSRNNRWLNLHHSAGKAMFMTSPETNTSRAQQALDLKPIKYFVQREHV